MIFNYRKTKIVNRTKIILYARLSDPCHNGHNDFAFTADIYEKAKNNRWVWTCGGCCHDEIAKYFPEVAKFIPLHLADEQGRPMYYVENAVYFFKEEGVKKGAEHLNIDEETANKMWDRIKVLDDSDRKEFKTNVERIYSEFGLFDKWQKLADECKEYFKSRTDNEI